MSRHHHGSRSSPNLAVLAFFKYYNFLGYNLGRFGAAAAALEIALPLGISFFTFHHIMYLVDLRKGKAPDYPLDRYALYISLFPAGTRRPAGALVAGDGTVRPQHLRARLAAPVLRSAFPSSRWACSKRSFSADPAGRIVDPIYAQALARPGRRTATPGWR